MGHAVGFDDVELFEVEGSVAELLKKANAAAEEDGDEVDGDFVEQAGFEALLGDIGGADTDVFVAGGPFGLDDGAFNAIGNEDEG
jgi:hypothetical protein